MLHSTVQRDFEVVTPLSQLAHVLTSTFVFTSHVIVENLLRLCSRLHC